MGTGYSVLGVHDGHCASAALMVDGKIVKATQEERFVNTKNEPGVPFNAIEYCVRDIERLDEVALGTTFIHKADWYREQDFWEEKTEVKYILNRIGWRFRRRLDPYFTNNAETRKKMLSKILSRLLIDFPADQIKVLEHHTSHAASAFYGSHYAPGHKVKVFTADGSGDGLSASYSIGGEDGVLRRQKTWSRDQSVGEIYSLTTYYLGFRPWEHEYKLMGMAPYSQVDTELLAGLFDIITVEGEGFKARVSAKFALDRLKQIYYRKRFDRICATIQAWFQLVMDGWIRLHIEGEAPGPIACAGGDFMNVKANSEIVNNPYITDMFVVPSAGDESTSIGACMKVYADYCVEHGLHPKEEITPLGPLYLGPHAEETDTETLLKKAKAEHGWEYWYEDNINTHVVDLLSEGEIVARCSGRLEFGARALGNRTILADASNMQIKVPLNAQVKHRDFWMPFAPSVLYEERKRLMDNPKDIRSPYMIMAYKSTEDGKRELAAGMHPWDFTIRPQNVERAWNPDYWDILNKFFRKTGNGGLLNTSFNLHGRPIVKNNELALWTMENTGLENLVIGNWAIIKPS